MKSRGCSCEIQISLVFQSYLRFSRFFWVGFFEVYIQTQGVEVQPIGPAIVDSGRQIQRSFNVFLIDPGDL